MRENLDKALKGLRRLEGMVTSMVPGDHGGLTGASGITETTFQGYLLAHHLPSVSVAEMTDAQAVDILTTEFWEPAHCDDLPSGLDLVHFFWYVNHGPGANKHLQCACEAWNDDGFEDGVGPLTLARVKTWDVNVLVEKYLSIQAVFYDLFAQHDPSQLKFLHGWKNRIIRTRDIIADRPLSV